MPRNTEDIPMSGRVPRVHNMAKVPFEHYEDAMGAGEATVPKSKSLGIIDLGRDVVLHTGQDTLSSSTVQKYQNNPGAENDTPYPTVFTYGNKLWVHDGHHRIVASRLRGEPSIAVQHWDSGE